MADKNIIIWQHGKCYERSQFEFFKRDYFSHILFSYKKNFEPIDNTNITNDSGWGCMLRCGQMILYQGIQMLFDTKQTDLMKYFDDKNGISFSLHNLCRIKKKFNIEIDSWIGPNTMCYLLYESIEKSDYKDKINMLIFNNNMIIRDHNISIPSLVFMPLRLGTENIENIYYHQLFILFTYKNFVGFVGGNGTKSYYFVAIDNNFDIYYLDPHYTQDINNEVTYITDDLYKINIKYIDPSLALCFSIKDQEEYEILCEKLSKDFKYSFIYVTESENNKTTTVDENNEWINILVE